MKSKSTDGYIVNISALYKPLYANMRFFVSKVNIVKESFQAAWKPKKGYGSIILKIQLFFEYDWLIFWIRIIADSI